MMIALERKPQNAKLLHQSDPAIFPERLASLLPPDRQPLVYPLDKQDELIKTHGIKNILKYRGNLYVSHKDAVGPYVGLKRLADRPPMPCCYQTKEDADNSLKFLSQNR